MRAVRRILFFTNSWVCSTDQTFECEGTRMDWRADVFEAVGGLVVCI